MEAGFAGNGAAGVSRVGSGLRERATRAAVILGNDTVVAARPSSPAQLANACRAAGFDIVVPPSWGDELCAGAYLEQLGQCAAHVVIACNCARARQVIAGRRVALEATEIAITSPAVAAARYVRLTYGDSVLVTYVGDCPSADDPAIHARFSPSGFFASLERDGIALASQPDSMSEGEAERWRRYKSIPGGLPARRWLARPPVDRVLREVDQLVGAIDGLGSRPRSKVLLDVSAIASCACGGNRGVVEESESPRSMIPIVDAPANLDLAPTPLPEPRAVAFDPAPLATAVAQPVSPQSAPAPLAVTAPAEDAVTRERIHRDRIQPERAQRRRPVVAPMSTKPTIERAAGASPRRKRSATLVLLPVVVLAITTALGAAAYALASGGRIQSRVAAGDSRPASVAGATVTDTGGTAPQNDSAEAASRLVDSLSATAPKDSTRVADARVAGDSATLDSATMNSTMTARRARRAPEVVPGWLPQGQKSWSPIDTTRGPRPDSSAAPRDSTVRRPKPDTIPRT